MEKLTLKELEPFLLGIGTERSCYLSPTEKGSIIKLSPAGHSKQTRREIAYFRFLQHNGVPFLHIPQFKGEISLAGFVGFKQEAVLDDTGRASKLLWEFIREDHPSKEDLYVLLNDLYQYLLRYNILLCDLHPANIMVQRRAGRTRLVLIDGLGSMNGVPIYQYIPWLGRKQIARRWNRFIKRDIEPCFTDK